MRLPRTLRDLLRDMAAGGCTRFEYQGMVVERRGPASVVTLPGQKRPRIIDTGVVPAEPRDAAELALEFPAYNPDEVEKQ